MLLTALLFICGFWLSGVAAIYAILGLLSIFPAAPITITLMGAGIEASKLVIASFMYRNWKKAPKLLLTYFGAALLITMLLTSMAVFGYLSKAHTETNVLTGDAVTSLQTIDEKIQTQRDNINQSKIAITQMDVQVNQLMDRTIDDQGASKAVRLRKQQKFERASLLDDIKNSQTEISKLQSERAPLASSVRKVEAEIGPIKYIANLIYGDKIDDTILDKAVRIVIIMIVSVFDPLAVLMLIAANWSLNYVKDQKVVAVDLESIDDTIKRNVDPKDYEPIKLNPIPSEKLEAYRKKLDEDRRKYEGAKYKDNESALERETDAELKTNVHQSTHHDNNDTYDSNNSSLVAAAAAVMDKVGEQKQLIDAFVDTPQIVETVGKPFLNEEDIHATIKEQSEESDSINDEATKVVKQFFAPLHLTENEGDSHEKAFSDLLYDEEKTTTDRNVHISDADKSTSQAISISSVATVSDEQPLVHIK